MDALSTTTHHTTGPTLLRDLPVDGLYLLFAHGRDFVPARHIMALRSERNYTCLYFRDGTSYLWAYSLCNVLARLPTSDFIRIHHSHAVNRRYIQSTEKNLVHLTDGSEWVVSRRRGRVL